MASLAITANGQPRLPQRPDSEGGDLSAEREGKEEEQSLLASPGGGGGGAVCKQPGTGKWEQLLVLCVCGGSLGNLEMWLVQPN